MKYVLVLVASLFTCNAMAGIIYSDDLHKANKGRQSYATDHVGKQTGWFENVPERLSPIGASQLDSNVDYSVEPIKLPVSITTDFHMARDLSWTNLGSREGISPNIERPSSVPEPDSALLMLAAIAGCLIAQRRMKLN